MADVAGARRALGLAVALGLAGTSCHRAEPSGSAPPSVSAASPEPSARPAVSEIHESNFDLTMRPAGAVVAGQPAAVEIAVAVKAGYHPNDKYPYKFRPADSAGVRYAAPQFMKEALKLEEHRATMTVGFTPEGKGERTVAGLFAFSLCSADQCQIEKRELALRVNAD
jgi:hypothetical protein